MIPRRLLTAVPILLIVSFFVFAFMDLVPGDSARRIAGEGATEQQIETVREELGLDRPLFSRYADWVGNAVTGDFGTSIGAGPSEPVATVIGRALPVTLSLLAVSSIIAIVVGMVLGTITALRAGGWLDRAVTGGLGLGVAVPNFWVGMVLVLIFAQGLGWFPTIGFRRLDEGVGLWLRHLILPSIALALTPMAEIARQLRASLKTQLDSEHHMAGLSSGLSPVRLVGKHAMKNAAVPVVTVFGLRFAQLLGGAVVVEQVFAMKGIGSTAVTAVQSGNFPVLMGVVIFSTIGVIIVNLLVDASYAYFDPKVAAA